MKKRKASLIVTSHNQLDYSKRMYESLKRHTHHPFEVIWVDSASTDGTMEWLSELKGITPVFVRRMGIGEAMLEGFARCDPESKYIGDLDNDIILTDGWLKRLVKHMEDDESIGACASMSNFAARGTIPFKPSKDNFNKDIQEFARKISERKGVRKVPWVNGSHTLLRRSAIEDVGLWNPLLWWAEDSDIGFRLNEAGWKTVYAHDTWVYHFGSRTTKNLDPEWKKLRQGSLELVKKLRIERQEKRKTIT